MIFRNRRPSVAHGQPPVTHPRDKSISSRARKFMLRHRDDSAFFSHWLDIVQQHVLSAGRRHQREIVVLAFFFPAGVPPAPSSDLEPAPPKKRALEARSTEKVLQSERK